MFEFITTLVIFDFNLVLDDDILIFFKKNLYTIGDKFITHNVMLLLLGDKLSGELHMMFR